MKFIRNNNARNAIVSHTISRDASPGCLSRFRTAASQFVHALLSCLHTVVENPPLSETRIQCISGKAFESDNFCPRDFTRRGGGWRAEQKELD